MVTQNDKTVILSSKLFNSCSKIMSTVELWWDEVISKWKIIVNYLFVCYDDDMMFQLLCSRGTRLLLATHFCLWAWNTLLTFCTKHSHSQKMATNVSNCTPKITMKKTKGHKLLFGVHWTGKTGLPKMRHAPLHTNLLSPPQRGFTATITFKN